MVTLTILSVGITMIFRSYIISLERMSYLTSRLYATNILDNRISEIERSLKVYNSLPFDLSPKKSIDIGGKEIFFKQDMNISAVENFVDLFQLELGLTWDEKDREVNLSRTSYLLDLNYVDTLKE